MTSQGRRTPLRTAVTAAILLVIVSCGRATPEGSQMDDPIKKSLDDFANRRIYRALDPQLLASIPDDKLEQAIFDYVATKLEGHYDNEVHIVDALPPGVRALYVTWTVEAEVNNGGFNQYYWNTEDRFSEQAVESFEFFGAVKHATLMREANAVRANESATLAKFKDRDTLEAFSQSYEESHLGPLDERFHKLDENLSALRVAKIRAMPVQLCRQVRPGAVQSGECDRKQ
jgi:hypothetical protein